MNTEDRDMTGSAEPAGDAAAAARAEVTAALTNHSPLPWRWTPCETEDGDPISGAQLVRSDSKPVWSVDCGDYLGLSDADAEFIVRAVNCHDELVAALKALAERHEWQPLLGRCVCDQHERARALLAKVVVTDADLAAGDPVAAWEFGARVGETLIKP